MTAHQLKPSRIGVAAAVVMAGLLWSVPAYAQYSAPDLSGGAIGEKYHVEFNGMLWNSNPFGIVSSEQFGQIGSQIDFLADLGYVKQRFKEMRIVLRPTKKSKFRIEYTPLTFQAETTFRRDIVFNGIKFPVAVPIESTFSWKVWRLGYEYDVFYRSRGFVGFLVDVRQTQADARIKTNSPIFSPAIDEFTTIKAPLPAIGLVARAYPIRRLALNFEVSGMKVPDVDPKYQGKYFDWDISGTVNVNDNVGFKMGWRKMTTFLAIEKDLGDVRFQGTWFGISLRY